LSVTSVTLPAIWAPWRGNVIFTSESIAGAGSEQEGPSRLAF
jgi:hypothetical protein